MAPACHSCGSTVRPADGEGFECVDCGEPTCADCKSIGVGLDRDACARCRG